MDKITKYLKKYWWACGLCLIAVLFAVIGIPLLINWIFSVPAKNDFFAVDWKAEDALAYYGSALGFIGTVIFSGLALWQNHIIKTESDKHTALLEQMEKKKNMPILCVRPKSCCGNCGELSLYLENISENVAMDVIVSRITILNEDGSEYWSNNADRRIPHLKDRQVDFLLKNPGLTSTKQVFSFQISYQDIFGQLHECRVKGKQTGNKISFPRFVVREVK